MVIDVPDGEGGITRGIGTPLTLDGKAEATVTPAPRVGEHSSALLRDFGFAQQEVAALMESGVVRQG